MQVEPKPGGEFLLTPDVLEQQDVLTMAPGDPAYPSLAAQQFRIRRQLGGSGASPSQPVRHTGLTAWRDRGSAASRCWPCVLARSVARQLADPPRPGPRMHGRRCW